MRLDDSTRLRHMRDACVEVLSYCEGKTRDEFLEERPFLQATIRCIEIIGEAASGVSPMHRDATPEVPWQKIIGMRNRLIHAYFEIDNEQVWITLQTSIPLLLSQIEPMIGTETES